MSAWEKAAVHVISAWIAGNRGTSARTYERARELLAALAPHLAGRDAAVWAQACEAQRLFMHHLNRHIQRLDEFPLATPELMKANGLSAGNSPGDAPRPLQPQSGGTK